MIKIKSYYINIKNNTRYFVLGIGIDKTNNTQVVVYKDLSLKENLYTRTLINFERKFKPGL